MVRFEAKPFGENPLRLLDHDPGVERFLQLCAGPRERRGHLDEPADRDLRMLGRPGGQRDLQQTVGGGRASHRSTRASPVISITRVTRGSSATRTICPPDDFSVFATPTSTPSAVESMKDTPVRSTRIRLPAELEHVSELLSQALGREQVELAAGSDDEAVAAEPGDTRIRHRS
jgi:hypothetical protein